MKRKNWIHGANTKGRSPWRRHLVTALFVVLLAGYLYLVLLAGMTAKPGKSNSGSIDLNLPPRKVKALDSASDSKSAAAPVSPLRYAEWRAIAVRLAQLSPSEILHELQSKDPFQTRAFGKRVEQAEAAAAAGGRDALSLDEFEKLFGTCPADRISLPDQRDHAKAAAFRKGTGFLFFQHLRKAGGTHFCTMAEANFPPENLPPYYCMPDYHWPRSDDRQRREVHACAGCLHQWTNEEILTNIKQHRIAGNEWDSFDPQRHFDLPAVFVTSFRKPIDRALSQYRFECVEERGCQIKDVGEFWKKRRDLYNVYTWTFSDVGRQASFATATTKEASQQRGIAIGKALDTIVKFHLVLAMEWLPYTEPSVKRVLGFSDTSTLAKHVRPHNADKKRNDSWKPEEYLTKEQYEQFSQNLALDEILTDAAHRLFLERLVCDEL
jgi:hypothetical protein